MIPEILQAYHDHPHAGHLGIVNTYKKVSSRFYWSSMRKDVDDYVKSCLNCQLSKPKSTAPLGQMVSRDIPESPFEVLTLDVIGPLLTDKDTRAQYIIIALCDLTRYIITKATRQINSKILAQFISDNIIHIHGVPRAIRFDGAKYNTAHLIQDLCTYIRIAPVYATPHSHHSQGNVERAIRSLETVIRSYVKTDPSQWAVHLASATLSLNSRIHSATGESSFFLVFGRHCITGADVLYDPSAFSNNRSRDFLEKLHTARTRSKFNSLKSMEHTRTGTFFRSPATYEVGDYVVVSYPHTGDIGVPTKFNSLYRGVYKISKVIPHKNYEVTTIDAPFKSQTIHLDRLKPILLRPEYLEPGDSTLRSGREPNNLPDMNKTLRSGTTPSTPPQNTNIVRKRGRPRKVVVQTIPDQQNQTTSTNMGPDTADLDPLRRSTRTITKPIRYTQ